MSTTRGYCPPVLQDAGLGFYPVESCYYCIEVKSTLSAPELRTSIDKAQAIRNLCPLPTVHAPSGYATAHGDRVINVLFAFGTDLTEGGKSEVERYREQDPSEDPLIQVICVVGRGHWFFQGGRNEWISQEASTDFNEILAFLAGFSNTLSVKMEGRDRPRFGNYLIGDIST